MKAVIMAGGAGTRLKPLTCNLAKPMVPVLDRPMMEHIAYLLKKHGITQVAATLWYRPDDIASYFEDGSGFGMEMQYFVEDEPLGTAGSVKNAEKFLDESFIVVSGDCLTDIDLSKAIEFHKRKKALATIVLTKVSNPLEYGVVITNKQGEITQFLEKPDWSQAFSDQVNTGIYILEPEVFDHIPHHRSFDFSKDLFPKLLSSKAPLYGYLADGYWSDVGNLAVYRRSLVDCLDRHVKLSDHIFEKNQAQIHPTAQLIEPVFIGEDVTIKAGAKVGPYCVIGSHTSIDEDAVIKQSVLWDRVRVGKASHLSGVVVAANCRLEPKVEAFEGVVIGENTNIGAQTELRPNVKVWPEKQIVSGSTLTESLIWGSMDNASLFTKTGISGDIRGPLTPETITKVGLSFGAFLKNEGEVIVTSDSSPQAKVAKRALTCGLVSGGVDVYDGGVAYKDATRFKMAQLGAKGAVYCASDGSELSLAFYDHDGKNLSRNSQRKIENIFAQEDFPRKAQDELGKCHFLPGLTQEYTRHVADIFANNLQGLPVTLQVHEGGEELGKVVREFLGHLAVEQPQAKNIHVDVLPDGWKIRWQDQEISSDSYWECFIHRVQQRGISQAFLPVNVSKPIVEKAHQLGIDVTYAPQNIRGLMEIADELGNTYHAAEDVAFYPGVEPLISLADALCYLAADSGVESNEELSYHREQVQCPWDKKGRVMRNLLQNAEERNSFFVDGIREERPNGWVLVIPDGDEPIFDIYSEADTPEQAQQMVKDYKEEIERLMESEG